MRKGAQNWQEEINWANVLYRVSSNTKNIKLVTGFMDGKPIMKLRAFDSIQEGESMRHSKCFSNLNGTTRWMKKKFGIASSNEGQSLVEFAFILPILLVIVMGILDFARAYNVNQVVTNASREGARVAILSGSSGGDVTTTINTYLASASLPGCATAGTNWGGGGASGAAATVTVSCNFTTLTGTLIPGWSGTFPISQTTTMRHE